MIYSIPETRLRLGDSNVVYLLNDTLELKVAKHCGRINASVVPQPLIALAIEIFCLATETEKRFNC